MGQRVGPAGDVVKRHELAGIRYREWRCSCGYVAESHAELTAHVADALAITGAVTFAEHLFVLLPQNVWHCARCRAAWGTQSEASATPCEVTS